MRVLSEDDFDISFGVGVLLNTESGRIVLILTRFDHLDGLVHPAALGDGRIIAEHLQ